MTFPRLLLIAALAVTWGQCYSSLVWRCRSSDTNDPYVDKLCKDRCVKGECKSYCVCNMTEVVHSCASFDFAPHDFISIDETTAPGTQIFTIPINDQETWTYSLERSGNIDGSLRRELQSYFNFRKFNKEYEMIVDKTPDLENINLKYSIQIDGLRMSLTCSSPGVPKETRELFVNIKPVNEYAPQFIGLPLIKTVPENTRIGSRVFTMANITIDRDVNPSTIEISVFRLHKYTAESSETKNQNLDSLAYFAMPNVQKGYITVKENLDYEALNAIGSTRFYLNISAADVHGWLSYTTLQIDITDINDLPPEFSHPSCPSHIPRSRPCPVSFEATIQPGYKGPLRHILPVNIQARDMDSIGDTIILSLDKGPGELSENAAKFSINNETGAVTVDSTFPKPAEIDLVIVAKEKSSLGRTTQAPLKVYVKIDNGIQNGRYPGPTNSPNNTIRVARDEGDEDYRIFIIIIGALSFLVIILAVISIFVLCSIKKDNKSKNKVIPVNNLTFTDNPTSYHYSQDAHNTDDDVGEISEMDSYWSKKSATKPPVLPFNTNENVSIAGSIVNHSSHNNQRLQSASSSHRSSRSSSSRRKSVPMNNQTLNDVHHGKLNVNTGHPPRLNGSILVDSKTPRLNGSIDSKTKRNDQQLHSEHVNALHHQRIQSQPSTLQFPVDSHVNRNDQQFTSEHINSLPHQKIQWQPSTLQVPAHAQVRNASQESSSNRSRKAKSVPNDMEAQIGYNSDKKATTPLNNQLRQQNTKEMNGMRRNSNKNEVDSLEGNILKVNNKGENPNPSNVTGRRIRIPSGVLIVKRSANTEGSETSSCPESENNSQSDVFEDNSSGCGGEMTTPASSTDKPRVSFQLAPPSMTDVLSILPMEHSSGISEDDLSAKSRSMHTPPPLPGHAYHQCYDLNDTTVTLTTNPINHIYPGADTMHGTSSGDSKNSPAISHDVHLPRKPAKLPALGIPRDTNNLLRLDSNSHTNADRARSEDVINRRLGEFRDTPETETERCRSLGDEMPMTNSSTRKKKRRRRALILGHREERSSGDQQGANDVTGRQGDCYREYNTTEYY